MRTTAAQITLMGLISNGDKSETYIATAVEPRKDRESESHRLVSGTQLPDHELDAILIGAGLAKSMKAKPGDYLTLMTTTVTGSLNAMDVRVAGVITTGVREYDDRAIKMPIEGAQQLLQTAKIEKLLVFLKTTEDTAAVEASIRQKYATTLESKDWSQLASFYHQVVMLYNGTTLAGTNATFTNATTTNATSTNAFSTNFAATNFTCQLPCNITGSPSGVW